MVVNIYDTANELSRQLRETQEYQGLQKAFEALKADSDTFGTFKKFQQAQADAQHKQMTGQQPTDEVSGKKVVQDLMNQERQVDSMLQQLNKTITSPIQDLYSEVMPKMPGQE